MGEGLRRDAPPWTILARADQGRVRERMEDAFTVELDQRWGRRRVHAVAVFDGLGGEPHGKEAALAAAAAVAPALQRGVAPNRVLAELNVVVARTGGATTAAIAILDAEPPQRRIDLFAVGDSAAYGTTPQAWRLLAPRDGASGNVVTDYLGNPSLGGHHASVELGAGDSVVLCTDGVDGVVDQARLRRLAATPTRDLDGAADALLQDVWARGAPDNATFAVIRRA